MAPTAELPSGTGDGASCSRPPLSSGPPGSGQQSLHRLLCSPAAPLPPERTTPAGPPASSRSPASPKVAVTGQPSERCMLQRTQHTGRHGVRAAARSQLLNLAALLLSTHHFAMQALAQSSHQQTGTHHLGLQALCNQTPIHGCSCLHKLLQVIPVWLRPHAPWGAQVVDQRHLICAGVRGSGGGPWA